MEKYINKPLDTFHTTEDIVQDYCCYQNKKKVATIYGISVKKLNQILNEYKKKQNPLRDLGMSESDFL